MTPNYFLTKSLLYEWIPDFELNVYDLSDLVVLDQGLEKECKAIGEQFHTFLAIYKKEPSQNRKGYVQPSNMQF